MFDINNFQKELEACLEHLNTDLSQIHTGRATPELIEDIKVTAYGTLMPMKSVGNITVSDSRTLAVAPWDKSLVEAIVKGISASNLGFQPSSEGDIVRIKVPEMTEERRLGFVKIMKEKIEHARISVRNVRQEAMQNLDKLQSGGMSQDECKRHKEEIEKRVKAMNESLADAGEVKEKELLTI